MSELEALALRCEQAVGQCGGLREEMELLGDACKALGRPRLSWSGKETFQSLADALRASMTISPTETAETPNEKSR